jgi:hypothetical protein
MALDQLPLVLAQAAARGTGVRWSWVPDDVGVDGRQRVGAAARNAERISDARTRRRIVHALRWPAAEYGVDLAVFGECISDSRRVSAAWWWANWVSDWHTFKLFHVACANKLAGSHAARQVLRCCDKEQQLVEHALRDIEGIDWGNWRLAGET